MYERLKELVERRGNEMLEDTLEFIKLGYFHTWNESEKKNPDRGIERYSTERTWAQYKAGLITRDVALERAENRARKENEKWRKSRYDMLAAAEVAKPAEYIRINVEWKRSPTWGYNPTATISAGQCNGFGKASGCGYDKGSAAISSALTECSSIMRVLYDYAEDQLANGFEPKVNSYNRFSVSWGEVLGYGAGYDVLPGFEGGVGFDTTAAILEKIGYIKKFSDRSTKTHDTYYFEMKEGDLK